MAPNLVFGIKLLDDFARTGTISRFVVETTGLRVPVGMHKALREYEQYARERRQLRPSSLAERMHSIAVFLDFLRSRGLESLDALQAEHLSAFVQTRTDWKPRTVACVPSSGRLFLQCLFMRGALPRDLSAAIPTVRLASNAKVPSAWEPELVEQLLAAVVLGPLGVALAILVVAVAVLAEAEALHRTLKNSRIKAPEGLVDRILAASGAGKPKN